MNEQDFIFDIPLWEQMLDQAAYAGIVPAGQLLSVLETEQSGIAEDVFEALQERRITLDFSDFPKIGGSGELAVRLRQEEQLVRQGDLLTGLPETDPLRFYLEELARMPVCGDLELLALEYREGKQENAEKMANLSLSRVVELAEGYVGRGVLLLDLIQEGSLGLWQGILNYCSGNYENTRDWWIHHYLAKAVFS